MTIIISEFSNYNEMIKIQSNFAYIFSNFGIYELELETQITEKMIKIHIVNNNIYKNLWSKYRCLPVIF